MIPRSDVNNPTFSNTETAKIHMSLVMNFFAELQLANLIFLENTGFFSVRRCHKLYKTSVYIKLLQKLWCSQPIKNRSHSHYMPFSTPSLKICHLLRQNILILLLISSPKCTKWVFIRSKISILFRSKI